MLEEFENGRVPVGHASFEVLFPWNDRWICMVVVPLPDADDCLHYIVMLPEDKMMVLRLDESGQWDELTEGSTVFSNGIGSAIEQHYAMCN